LRIVNNTFETGVPTSIAITSVAVFADYSFGVRKSVQLAEYIPSDIKSTGIVI